ncbi:segregation and condensation protein A [Clostridia bacterium]|nr:segregation and condensation protein A [Clostridia bacterium]
MPVKAAGQKKTARLKKKECQRQTHTVFLKTMDETTEQLQIDYTGGYKVHLKDFDGPLDLLLHLIKNAKLDIKDIFVSEITSQYLEYMKQLDTIDLERASEFLEVAATLLEMKSKSLLPNEKELATPDGEDEGSRLIRRLEEYRLIQEAGEKLRQLENVDRFYKLPDASAGDFRDVLKSLTLDGLLDAFTTLLHKVIKESEPIPPKEIKKDRFTVAEKMSHIKDAIVFRKTVSFFELFSRDYSRSEIINTFLALLELLKLQIVTAAQNAAFDDIAITYNETQPPEEVESQG